MQPDIKKCVCVALGVPGLEDGVGWAECAMVIFHLKAIHQ